MASIQPSPEREIGCEHGLFVGLSKEQAVVCRARAHGRRVADHHRLARGVRDGLRRRWRRADAGRGHRVRARRGLQAHQLRWDQGLLRGARGFHRPHGAGTDRREHAGRAPLPRCDLLAGEPAPGGASEGDHADARLRPGSGRGLRIDSRGGGGAGAGAGRRRGRVDRRRAARHRGRARPADAGDGAPLRDGRVPGDPARPRQRDRAAHAEHEPGRPQYRRRLVHVERGRRVRDGARPGALSSLHRARQ